MNARQLLMLLGLAGSAALALFGDRTPTDQDAVAEGASGAAAARATAVPARPAPVVAVAAAASLAVLVEREPWAAPRGDVPQHRPRLFAARSWDPPPAPVKADPAPPTAPPLPYVFLGKKFEAGHWEVFLGAGEQTQLARVGQTLDGKYRVERIAPPELTLTYLPLQQVQTLNIGAPE